MTLSVPICNLNFLFSRTKYDLITSKYEHRVIEELEIKPLEAFLSLWIDFPYKWCILVNKNDPEA